LQTLSDQKFGLKSSVVDPDPHSFSSAGSGSTRRRLKCVKRIGVGERKLHSTVMEEGGMEDA
jgi:hypothetical protein